MKKGVGVVGQTGAILNFWLLNKVGIDRRQIVISNTLRCFPSGGKYPTGAEKVAAESACRQYDALLKIFKPDAVVVTLHPAALMRDIVPLPLVLEDLKKAKAFVQQGLKVLVLMGGHACEVLLGFGSNCFHANTCVWMADGTWKRIYKVAAGEAVMSMYKGQLVRMPVLAATKRIEPTRWLSVQVDGAHRPGQGKKLGGGVICTPNHEWITPKGKVRTENLKADDLVFIPAEGNDDLIFGTILGDSHVSEYGHLRVIHTNKGWADAKATSFHKTAKELIMRGGFRPGESSWYFSTRIGKYWRHLFYPQGKKIWIPPTNAAQIAVWYLDDGSITHRHDGRTNGKLGGKLVYHLASIACQAFFPQAEEIKKWAIFRYGSGAFGREGNLRLCSGAARKLFVEIAGYVPPSMDYKLPPDLRGKYNGWLDTPHVMTGRVLSVAPVDIPKRRRQPNTQYCLEVADTHTFFTRCGLVSNSTRWRGHYELLSRFGGFEAWYEKVIARAAARALGKAATKRVSKKKQIEAGMGVVEEPKVSKRRGGCANCSATKREHPTESCKEYASKRRKTSAIS